MSSLTESEKELLRKLLEKERHSINLRSTLEDFQSKFRHSLMESHDLTKMVGVFSPFDVMIPTLDRGKIKGKNIIKKLSKDLSQNSFSVLTCFHIRTKNKTGTFLVSRLMNDLKESESKIIDFSQCLATAVPNAIFIWNASKGSTVEHESRAFHRNFYGDNIISFNVIFSQNDTDCTFMKKIYDNICICQNTDLGKCSECHFHKELNFGNREPLIKNKNSVLVISKTYKDIIPVFKDSYKIFKGQRHLTKK